MTKEKEDKPYDLEERLIDFAVRIFRVAEQRTAEYRILNIECRRVESLRSDFFKIKDRKVDSILISNHYDWLPLFCARIQPSE